MRSRVEVETLKRLGMARELTLFGRSVLLICAEILANAVIWVTAGLTLGQHDGLIGLALLAWTIGLRHGLDADHISAIDNATRQLVSLGKLPITCGLFFSLGHSTIVIAVNIAIAISADIYDKLDKVGTVGGLVGTSVSASFLFLIACINIFFLHGAIKHRNDLKGRRAAGLPMDEVDPQKIHGGGCLVRIISPVLKAVDKSWKMYPVGILFGFGFDTASSIALLAVSAIAQRGTNGESISHGKVVILPFLFTAGMSLVDSLDSILMLYAYAAPSRSSKEGKMSFFVQPEKNTPGNVRNEEETLTSMELLPKLPATGASPVDDRDKTSDAVIPEESSVTGIKSGAEGARNQSQRNLIALHHFLLCSPSSSLSGQRICGDGTSRADDKFSISLIEIMGLIGDNCASCSEAANAADGGGLAGSWWRFWGNIKKGQEQEFFDKFDSVVHSSSNTDYVEKKEQLGLTMNQEEECDEETTIYKVRVSAHHPFEEQHVREYTDLLETSCQERGEGASSLSFDHPTLTPIQSSTAESKRA
ncbi:nickel/cobalt transporter (NiCoT) family protein, partial [Tremellales sp. Uapishka_1]